MNNLTPDKMTVEELFDFQTKVVLNLIRTNNTGDEAQKYTQAVLNMAHAKQLLTEGKAATKKIGAGAS